MRFSPLLFLATANALSNIVIDKFANSDSNALGNWHGGDEGMGLTWGSNKLTIKSSDSDYSFYTQLTPCFDLKPYNSAYLHIKYSGSAAFSIALQQHNSQCNEDRAPYPETWDEVRADRYASATDIYVPLSHFNIYKPRSIGFAFKSFYYPTKTTTLTLVEIVTAKPASWTLNPAKWATAPLVFGCSRPNSFAFGIDDGVPELAQKTLQILRDEKIKVTFFTVANALEDTASNFTNVYKQAIKDGHQLAYHTYSHPKLESFTYTAPMDEQFNKMKQVVQAKLGITSLYFRPPYGNIGARSRERLQTLIPGIKVINWSVDVQDWIYGESGDPGKNQLKNFKADFAKGGNLAVAHYLYPSTVNQLKEMIQHVKKSGKQIMRVDQCLQDPAAPAL